jgi:hypothetical protein
MRSFSSAGNSPTPAVLAASHHGSGIENRTRKDLLRCKERYTYFILADYASYNTADNRRGGQTHLHLRLLLRLFAIEITPLAIGIG